jgi:hypothetical protein
MKKKNFACDEVLRQANLNIQSSYCLARFIAKEIIKAQKEISDNEGPRPHWDNWDYAMWKKNK